MFVFQWKAGDQGAHYTGPWEAVGMETKASYQVGESSTKPVGNHGSEGRRRSRRDS